MQSICNVWLWRICLIELKYLICALQESNACNNRCQIMSTQKHQSLLLAADRTENIIQLLQPFTLSLSLLSFQTCGKTLGRGYIFWVLTLLLKSSIDWRWNHSHGSILLTVLLLSLSLADYLQIDYWVKVVGLYLQNTCFHCIFL